MPTDYTNDRLLENIRLRALLPESQNLYSPERLLMLANDQLQISIFPMMMETKGDYFLHINTQTLTTSLSYPIPGDAVGNKIKGVYWRDSNWPANQPDCFIPMINIQDLTNQAAGLFNYMACYIQDNSVYLTNTRNVVGRLLRQRYYKRAYELVANSSGAQITDASTANIVCNAIPSDWSVGDVLMLTNQEPPFETVTTTLEITALPGSNVINLVQTDPDEPVLTQEEMEGNWLTLVGETVIAQITPEAHPILAQDVAVKCLEGMSDPNMGTSQLKLQEMKTAFVNAMTPRMDGTAKKLIQRNGTLFWNRVGRGYWIGGR